MSINIVLTIVIIAAALGIGYWFLRKRKAESTQPGGSNWPIGWAFQYSVGMTPGQTPENFDFPVGRDGVHYCVKQAPKISLGQNVAINFNISGTGTLVPTEEGVPSAKLRLYMQRKGDNMGGAGEYQQYRYWSLPVELKSGDLALSASLDPANWTDVYGKAGTEFPNQFGLCVANAGLVGFTFGGSHAGHGVYAKDAPVHFTLKSYDIA